MDSPIQNLDHRWWRVSDLSGAQKSRCVEAPTRLAAMQQGARLFGASNREDSGLGKVDAQVLFDWEIRAMRERARAKASGRAA